MAYQVIARKWRPNLFADLVGQSHISQTLLNALRGDRVPHALLLTGPRGTGKTSTARILAKSLRCPNAKDFVPCNQCSECNDIAASRSLDVREIDGASNNGVDAIRELRDTVGVMPSSGKFKIYIIDEVHMLTGPAFNALLKTLEEPPEHVVFVMATTEVQKIPNTVLSRCQRFDFRKISTRLVAEHLIEICKREGVKAEDEALWAVARQGDGSMRDSQSLLDQVISFCNGELTLKKITEVLGLTDRGLLMKTLEALITRNTKMVVDIIESLFDAGYDPIVYMKDLLEELRHLIFIKVAADRSEHVIDLPKEEIERLATLAQNLSEEDIHILFDMALKGAQDLHRAQDTRVVLEMILLRMSIAPRLQDLRQASAWATSTAGGVRVSGSTMAPITPAPSASATPASSATNTTKSPPVRVPVTITTATEVEVAGATNPHSASAYSAIDERWDDFVGRVRKVNGLIAAKLEQLHLLKMNQQQAVLGVPEKYKFLYAELTDKSFQNKIVNYLNTFWGPGHTLEVQMINPEAAPTMSPKKLQEKKTEDYKEAITRQVEEHPLVRQAKSILNTQIKSIREN